ncbi:TonB-dependent receptor plug domain-containing protein [Acidobacteriota bacterium]
MSKKKLSFVLIFVFFCTLSLVAVEIKGRVTSIKGERVSEAFILHRASKTSTVTDENGEFTLEVPSSREINLEIVHPDYLEKLVALNSEHFHSLVVISLTPSFRPKEEVTVTAFRYPEASTSVPAAESVLAKENLEESMPVNISEVILALPGVSNIGAGGFSLVPNIRGLARRRILILLDNARVTSERRTGASASFINPRDIDKIEVLRSPSSVFYGSDAIGGVLHILTRKPSMSNRFNGGLYARYGAVNQEKSIGLNLDGNIVNNVGYYFSFQAIDAENYSSPDGEVLQSYFSQGSLLGKIFHQTNKRDITLSFLGARGYNIGKANKDSASKPTWYPKESQNFIQFQWKEKDLGAEGELDVQIFANPQFLETIKEKIGNYKTKESFSRTEGLDYGIFLSYSKALGKFRLVAGTDYFGRSGINAFNKNTSFDAFGQTVDSSTERPYENGTRRDLGVFVSVDYVGLENIDLVGGIRWDTIYLKARPGGDMNFMSSQYDSLTGFLGSSFKISSHFIVFGNVAKAYRVPSLSELFYSGITGRGSIVAQPGLKPENSINLDGGVRFFTKSLYVGLYGFVYEIKNLIERYLIEPSIYTYGNVDTGRISGFEIEFEYFPVPGWKLYGNYFAFNGKSLKTGDPLNDIPAGRLYLGTQFWWGHLSLGINSTLQQEKNRPGPAEMDIPGYIDLNFTGSYFIGSSIRLFFVLSNALNNTFLARPDPEAVFNPGRNFQFGLNYSF